MAPTVFANMDEDTYSAYTPERLVEELECAGVQRSGRQVKVDGVNLADIAAPTSKPLCPLGPPWPRRRPRHRIRTERSRDERSVRRLALASIESFDGGVEEFVEFIPSRRRNSAFSASNVSTRAANPTISAASSSYDGSGGSGADTTQIIDDQGPKIEPDTPSPITDFLSH